jgi:hypothetical protein
LTNNTERLRITSSGTVGINTTSVDDSAQIQIRGSSDGVLNLDTTDGRGSFIRFKENGTTKAWVGCSEGLGTGGDQDDLGLRASDNIFFRTGTSNKVSINSSGTLNVSNSDTGNDSAVNILKSSGDTNFNDESPTRFYLYYAAGSSGATHHFARMISQTDWTFCKWTVKQIKMQYSPSSNDLATWDNTAYYSSHNFYVSNFNQGGSTSGGGNENYIGRNQNLGPGGTFQIHNQANGGYYRNCWATDYYVSLGAYIHVLLEITVYHFGGNAWDSSESAYDIYPANFGSSASQANADSWGRGRGIWFDAAPGTFKMRSGTTPGVIWDT